MMNVPFGRDFAGPPDLGYWYPTMRPDGGIRPFGVMGQGLAPQSGLAAPMPQAQVPAPDAAGNVFSDTPWFDPYGMRGTYMGGPSGGLLNPSIQPNQGGDQGPGLLSQASQAVKLLSLFA